MPKGQSQANTQFGAVGAEDLPLKAALLRERGARHLSPTSRQRPGKTSEASVGKHRHNNIRHASISERPLEAHEAVRNIWRAEHMSSYTISFVRLHPQIFARASEDMQVSPGRYNEHQTSTTQQTELGEKAFMGPIR